MSSRVLPGVATMAIAAILAAPLFAQAPSGSGKLSRSAVTESLTVLKQLDNTVRSHPDSAAAWYRRGIVAWALYERDKTPPPISGLDWTLLGRLADTSLRIASMIDDENAEYRMMAGRFLLMSGVSITRLASYGFFNEALAEARKSSDPRVHAETAVEAGRVHWRRYDSWESGWLNTADMDCDGNQRKDVVAYVARDTTGKSTGDRAKVERSNATLCAIDLNRPDGFAGEMDYIKAETLFREAFEADPSFERGYRQLAMLFAARYRWQELASVARARIAVAPTDAWAWLTLGLATQRMRDATKGAGAAFEKGVSLLSKTDRARLDRLERIIRPDDTTRFLGMDSVTHAAIEALYWKTADPLWGRDGNEARAEFLARVTYSELRWSAEEMRVHGADTDRGYVHIRFGPPDFIRTGHLQAEVLTSWSYNSGLRFAFKGMRTFATARFEDPGGALDVIRSTPARWDNITTTFVDSMAVQSARFRADHDSVDVFLAALPPVAQIQKVADVATNVKIDFWLMNAGLVEVAHSTTQSDVTGVRTYQTRVAPGAYLYRAEASAEGSLYAARATAALSATTDTLTGFSTRGFGMSDVLIASDATARGAPQRWRDLTIHPIVGTVVRRGKFAMVWENYDLADDRGSSKYTVTVTIDRQRSLPGRILAQVIGRVGNAMGVDRTEDRVTIHYDRNVPHASAVLDNVELGLGETPPGDYLITVRIDDQITGRATQRTLRLTVAE